MPGFGKSGTSRISFFRSLIRPRCGGNRIVTCPRTPVQLHELGLMDPAGNGSRRRPTPMNANVEALRFVFNPSKLNAETSSASGPLGSNAAQVGGSKSEKAQRFVDSGLGDGIQWRAHGPDYPRHH